MSSMLNSPSSPDLYRASARVGASRVDEYRRHEGSMDKAAAYNDLTDSQKDDCIAWVIRNKYALSVSLPDMDLKAWNPNTAPNIDREEKEGDNDDNNDDADPSSRAAAGGSSEIPNWRRTVDFLDWLSGSIRRAIDHDERKQKHDRNRQVWPPVTVEDDDDDQDEGREGERDALNTGHQKETAKVKGKGKVLGNWDGKKRRDEHDAEDDTFVMDKGMETEMGMRGMTMGNYGMFSHKHSGKAFPAINPTTATATATTAMTPPPTSSPNPLMPPPPPSLLDTHPAQADRSVPAIKTAINKTNKNKNKNKKKNMNENENENEYENKPVASTSASQPLTGFSSLPFSSPWPSTPTRSSGKPQGGYPNNRKLPKPWLPSEDPADTAGAGAGAGADVAVTPALLRLKEQMGFRGFGLQGKESDRDYGSTGSPVDKEQNKRKKRKDKEQQGE